MNEETDLCYAAIHSSTTYIFSILVSFWRRIRNETCFTWSKLSFEHINMIDATLNLTCFNKKANCFFNSAAVLIHASCYAEVVYLTICMDKTQNEEEFRKRQKTKRKWQRKSIRCDCLINHSVGVHWKTILLRIRT